MNDATIIQILQGYLPLVIMCFFVYTMRTMLKPTIYTIVSIALLLPMFVAAEEQGFVKGVWFDPFPFFAGEAVSIKVAIFNQSGQTLGGRLLLNVNEIIATQKNISVSSDGLGQYELMHVFDEGEQTINVILEKSNGESEETSVAIDSLIESGMVVDIDTDGDRIGNATDEDDDGDGFSDQEELEKGTDPLDPNDQPKVVVQQIVHNNATSIAVINDPTPPKTRSAANTITDTLQTAASIEEAVRSTIYEILEHQKQNYKDSLVDNDVSTRANDAVDSVESPATPRSVLFNGDVGAGHQVLFILLSILTFMFSSWWLFVFFLVFCLYTFWQIRRLYKGHQNFKVTW